MVRLVKRKKSSRIHGKNMGTAGTGARKNKRGSGHRGGKGLSGTGKRADHKKTLIQKLHGHNYFGKKGITRGNNKRDIRQRINVGEIQSNLEKFGEKKGEAYEVSLPKYKIVGAGEVKDKLNVTCSEISESAKEKIEAAGGSVTLKEKKVLETPFVQKPEKKKK
jgi:large subunit ribosomal protein L15